MEQKNTDQYCLCYTPSCDKNINCVQIINAGTRDDCEKIFKQLVGFEETRDLRQYKSKVCELHATIQSEFVYEGIIFAAQLNTVTEFMYAHLNDHLCHTDLQDIRGFETEFPKQVSNLLKKYCKDYSQVSYHKEDNEKKDNKMIKLRISKDLSKQIKDAIRFMNSITVCKTFTFPNEAWKFSDLNYADIFGTDLICNSEHCDHYHTFWILKCDGFNLKVLRRALEATIN